MQKERHELRENNDLPPGLAKPAQRALTRAGYSRLEQFTKLSEEKVLQLHGMGPRPWNRSVAPSPPGAYLSLTAPEAPSRAHASRSSEAGISWFLRTSGLRSSRKFRPTIF